MITPYIEQRTDSNGKYIRYHHIGAGKHGFDVTADGKGDWWDDIDIDDVKRIRNGCDKFMSHNYGKG